MFCSTSIGHFVKLALFAARPASRFFTPIDIVTDPHQGGLDHYPERRILCSKCVRGIIASWLDSTEVILISVRD